MIARIGIMIAALTLAVCGCTPMSTFQPPHVLDGDESAIGIGAVQVQWSPSENPDDAGFFPSVWYRTAVTDRTDMGVKVGLWEGVAVDLKREFVSGSFSVAGDIQMAVVGFDASNTVILRPVVLGGTRHLYGGVWWSLPMSDDCWDQMTGFVFGASLGDKRSLMLEYNWFREKFSPDASMSFGLAFQSRSDDSAHD